MEETTIEVVDELAVGEHLLLTHEPLNEARADKLTISGHIHPGVMIRSKGRQSFRLPCFYHHRQMLILPAFGQLTGLHLLKKATGATFYAVFGDEVISL